MASENHIFKLSNAGGFKALTRYPDMLAGNTTWNPWSPTGAYDSLATIVVPSGGLTTITFAGIPTGYKHLQIRASNTNGGTIRLNGDTTTTNYRYHVVYGDGATAGAGSSQNAYYPVSGSVSRTAEILDILDYSSTSKNKTMRIFGGWDNNGTGEAYLASNLWISTATITSITLNAGSSFPQYSSFALYGVK